jgi:hypothetical protein
VFGWFNFEQRGRRNAVKLDRAHLEARTRRFLKAYLAADETRKPQFYHAVDDASAKCHPPNTDYQLEDAEMAEATSRVAMKTVLAREKQSAAEQDGKNSAFVTDAYATVAVAYHRAAGAYLEDKAMQELGTAAVHLLTMATSYVMAQKDRATLPD